MQQETSPSEHPQIERLPRHPGASGSEQPRSATQCRSQTFMQLAKPARTVLHHLKHHFGVGIVCAVAYFDPGNWSTDLLAGSKFGYKLLFVVLLAGLGAVVLQILSCKLGCVTGLDLASHCRLLMYNHPRYPRLVRYLFLYPLYALSELAIISTDIAELLGSAIGIVLIIPAIPLPVAVFLTALDCLVILFIGDPTKGKRRSIRIFEIIIITLVSAVFICLVVLLARVSPQWEDVFKGYLPSKTLVESSALLSSVGIIGATVMPHALFLGSQLSTCDRLDIKLSSNRQSEVALPSVALIRQLSFKTKVQRSIYALFRPRRVRQEQDEDSRDTWSTYADRKNNDFSFIKAHYKHGLWDIVLSLLGVAAIINSAILILAGTIFFFGGGQAMDGSSAGLFDAFNVLKSVVGSPAAIVFAIALICSGQSASITATLAGQIVSEGFIQWTVSPFLRRLITRLLGLIPALVVAVALGRKGIDSLLVISQVILSIVLPFVMLPLVWLTSSSLVMRVEKPKRRLGKEEERCDAGYDGKEKGKAVAVDMVDSGMQEDEDEKGSSSKSAEAKIASSAPEFDPEMDVDEDLQPENKGKARQKCSTDAIAQSLGTGDVEAVSIDEVEYIDYSNGWPLTILSYGIWLVILAANGYLIVTLAL